jgi:Domain of unknown function (DUF4189)
VHQLTERRNESVMRRTILWIDGVRAFTVVGFAVMLAVMLWLAATAPPTTMFANAAEAQYGGGGGGGGGGGHPGGGGGGHPGGGGGGHPGGGGGGASAQQNQFYSTLYEGKKAFYAGNGTSKAAAIKNGRAVCEAKDTKCKGLAWVYSGYIAIAEGKDPQGGFGYAWGIGHTQKKAEAQSVKGCKAPPPFTGCKAVDSFRTLAYDPNKTTKGGPL